jgi:hypothetical protein
MSPGNASSPTVNTAAGLIVIALVIFGLYVGRDLLIPLALAGILSFILFPVVRRLTNWGVPQGLAVTLVGTALIAAWERCLRWAPSCPTAGGSTATRDELTRKGAVRTFVPRRQWDMAANHRDFAQRRTRSSRSGDGEQAAED